MNETIKYIILLIIAMSIAVFAGCNSKSPKKNTLMVSIEPQRWLLEQIIGDKMIVKSLMSSDADPENFDPSISLIKEASNSRLLMKTGTLPWENNLIEKLAQNNQNLKVIDTSVGIIPIEGTHKHHKNESSLDPHVWTSIINAKIIAQNMYEAVLEMDPINSEFYTDNFKKLTNKLDSLNKSYTNILKSSKVRNFLILHPSLSYFARDYNLDQIALTSEGKEFSPASLKEKLKNINSQNPEILFYQKEGEEVKMLPYFEDVDIKKIEINPLSYNWDREMDRIVNALVSGYDSTGE